ncbi:MAG: amidohydrolase family protein [Thermodesulfobacteriota bacterium]
MSDGVTLVRAGWIVAAHDLPAIMDGAVAVKGDSIGAVGTYAQLSQQYPGAPVIGDNGHLLIPGLINAHSHGRGLTDFQRGALDNTLESWLIDTRKYIPVATYDDVALSAIRLLKSGVTTTMHNHILKDPVAYESEFEEAIQAYADSGMRVQFNPAVRNDNPFVYGDNTAFLQKLPEDVRQALTRPLPAGALGADNFVRAVKDLRKRSEGPMCKIGFGPVAPQWCTDALLTEIRQAADEMGAPVHLHAVQSVFQKIYGLKRHGKTLIAHLGDIGLLGPNLVLGHCVWPTESDITLLAATGTGVTHHPSCNLRQRNGIAPAFAMLRAGVKVGLGLDGKSINDDDDFIQEMKVCYRLHRLPSLELDSPHLTSREVLLMATQNPAELLGFGQELGRLEAGRKADLVLLDYEAMCAPYVDPVHDPVDVLLYRGLGRHVRTVMVAGRIVVQDGKVLTLDEAEIGRRLTSAACRPRTDAEREFVRVMDVLKKHVIEFYRGWSEELKIDPFYTVNSRIDGL